MLAIHYFERHEEASTPLQLRVFLPDDPEDAPSQSVDIPPREYAALPPTDEDLRAAMNFALQISPLIVTKSGLIKVRMVRGDDTIRLGSLRVKLLTEAEAIAAGLIQAPAI